jgi:hypothetical protein
MKNSILFIAFFLCIACSDRYSPEIEAVLKQARDNRKELANVLKHYSREPADSLKLRAAEFLIVNMPGKYSEYFDAPWNDVATVHLRWTSSSDKKMVLEHYGLGKPVTKQDVEHITADYLINNIELAFKVWREQPWGKHITFETFCEEILPYRLGTEPLENWREKALASFADIYRSFQEDTTMITAVIACGKVNDLLPRFRMDKDFPAMNYSQLMASSRGMCDHMTALATFAMRALGIPVTSDYTPQWPRMNIGHSWNTVCDSAGNHISFLGTESNPGKSHQATDKIKAKTYRKTFAKQNNINTGDENIPTQLQDKYFKDVSSEHAGCADLEIPVRFPSGNNTGYAYLALMGEQEWGMVTWGQVEDQHIRYGTVGVDVLYLPVSYVNWVQTPANYPFWLNGDGSVRFFEPDTTSLQRLSITEQSPMESRMGIVRMRDGVFEGANQKDFSDAQTLHTIVKRPERCFNVVKLKRKTLFRYVRYVSPPEGFCNVAEIKFLGTNGVLWGKNIGTPGSWGNLGLTCDKAFDGDSATYYDAAIGDSAWTGLDLGRAENICEIHFHPRFESVSIYGGDTYDLSYWSKQGWTSLGQQTATGAPLLYQAPRNALFCLKNITNPAKITRIFTVQDGVQKWL